MSARIMNGWERLPNGYDVEFRHGIPVRLADNGRGSAVPGEVLCEEISALARLHVQLGEWTAGEKAGEREAPLFVSGSELPEVLKRLARSAAAVFVDRYRRPVRDGDVDWDRMEYLKDFRAALEHCRLAWSDVDKDACFDDYVATMHRETRRLARSKTLPPVEPE